MYQFLVVVGRLLSVTRVEPTRHRQSRETEMAPGTFLAIGFAGMAILAISALLDTDDTDVEADVDTDVDVDVGADGDIEAGGSAHLGAAGVLEWFSLKALAVVAVGFGFVGWATASNDGTTLLVWTAATSTGLVLWILAVRVLFPWLKRQQGDDLQPLGAYQGLSAEVVVRIPRDGIGIVQFVDPNGAVVRRDARSAHRDHEVSRGTKVMVVLSTAEHVVVDEFEF
jgi:hypothetical protein